MPGRSPGRESAFLAPAYAFVKTRSGLLRNEGQKNTVVENTFFCYNIILWSIIINFGTEERV
ncbi:MAG: hypothetical protein ACYS9C_04950 [Planctomycetota bacterium]|jgi:hypothetical protein